MAHLSPSSSILDGADPLFQGECALLRIPHLNLSQTATVHAGSPLPPTSGGRTPQYLAFVRSSVLLLDGAYEVVVYPIVSFSNQGGALTGRTRLPPAIQARLIPLLPLLSAYTPPAFGNPIELGAFMLDMPSWLFISPHKFTMPKHRAFKRFEPQVRLSHQQLRQIDIYRTTLEILPANGRGSGSGRGGTGSSFSSGGRGAVGGGPRQGAWGRGPGQGAQGGPGPRRGGGPEPRRGGGSGPRPGQGWNSRGKKDRGYNEKRNFMAPEPEELCVATEDVDDDPRGATATFKDDLALQ